MATLETVLIFLYMVLGIVQLSSMTRIIYGVFAVSGFFFLRFSLCPSCFLYERGCTSGWNKIGKIFKVKQKDKQLFYPFTRVATVYWMFVFLFPLIVMPARESLFLFVLLPVVIFQVIRCKQCPAGKECFFGNFVRKRGKD